MTVDQHLEMSLKDLRLPAYTVTELYGNCLYEIATGVKPPSAVEPIVETVKKSVAAVVQGSVPAKDAQFIERVLGACHLTSKDIIILNAAEKGVNIKTIKEQWAPKCVLLFGLEPVQLGLPINFPMFKQQEYDDCCFLYAPAVSELNQDSANAKLLKSKLWVCLRKLFNV